MGCTSRPSRQFMIDSGTSMIAANSIEPTITLNGDVKIELPNGKTIKVAELLERLEALETVYMEEKLLGKT